MVQEEGDHPPESASGPVDDGAHPSLREDAEDLLAFEARAGEPDLSFTAVLEDLRRRGRL